ncbi:AAA family ATPase [Nostoc sp. FACHB-87]|uniref:UvrD-helicase domain-containing protein n=1 Tax=Nostocaceae TaxID=1162 RepID=UPI001683DAF3|nr:MULTISPECIES: UvrD-helicase domain-containing protein [Nostocaceae]MBD2458821.1 AAA family ATPase [Nostoc sp. FACHB-87]MBD2479874.1 AAA family ATPase [Anabaena sp. FACHB-83]
MGQWIDFKQTVNQRLLREDLDKEQTKVRNMNIKGHALVRGIAGSGKSLVLRNRVEKIINEFDNVLILSYNRFMSGWLKSKLRDKGISREVTCNTFHSWAYRNLKYDYKFDNNDASRLQIIDLAKKSDLKYQAILVDEAQDFYDEWFIALQEILDDNTKSLFFVYDNTQSVYGQSHRRKQDWSWRKLGIDVVGRSQIFDVNYRNSPEILELAWEFILGALSEVNMKVSKKEQAGGRIGDIIQPKKRNSRSSNIKPILLQISDEAMPSNIAQQVKLALSSHKESSIGVLVHPQNWGLKNVISKELAKLNIEHHAPKGSTDRDMNVVDRPFVIVDSWNALKGVEFDAVIIAGLDEANEYPDDLDKDFQEKAGIYTAITRARDHLVMLYDTKNSIVDLMENALSSPAQLESED